MKKFLSVSIVTIFCMFAGGVFAQQLVCNPMGVCATPGTSAALVVCNSALGCSYANESTPRRPAVLSGYTKPFDVVQVGNHPNHHYANGHRQPVYGWVVRHRQEMVTEHFQARDNSTGIWSWYSRQVPKTVEYKSWERIG
jgi:hypothetical protein